MSALILVIFKIVLDFVQIYVQLLDKNNFSIISLRRAKYKIIFYLKCSKNMKYSQISSCNQLNKILLIVRAVLSFPDIKLLP